MKNYKLKKAHILSVICVLSAVALIALLFQTTLFNPGRTYYDNKLLFKETDNFHQYGTNGGPLKANEKNTFRFEKFSGSQTVYVFQAADDMQLSFTWDITVNHGKFKVVLIDLKNSEIIETVCDGTGKGNKDILDLIDGEYRIKFVGDNANITGEFYISQ